MKPKIYLILTLLIITLLFSACSGLTDSGSTATTVSTPYPTSPKDNSRDVILTPTFIWDGAADKLQISISYDFSTVKYEFNVTGVQSYIIETGKLNKNTLYFWRVGKSYSDQMSWSGSLKFITAP